MTDSSQLPQADRFADSRDSNPYWNESVWFSFSKVDERVHGFVHYYFRPNMGMLNGGPAMWDASGTLPSNCLYYNWSNLQAVPAGAQKFDMRAPNSLTVKVLEPLTRYSIGYDHEGFQMDLEWSAIGPVHELKSRDPGQKATQRFHIEQPGRMRGIVRSDGREFPIDCFSMRDTSYGPREYGHLTTGGYFWGIADKSAFHAITKGDGAEQKLVGGFLWKDGELGTLVSGTRRITQWGRHGPRRCVFEAIDQHGRSMKATGIIDEGLVFTGYTDHTVVWSLLEWDFDGVKHWGDNQEFCSAVRFRRIARGELKLGG
jgi:hypothetical protein